jgi:hypothetical protein
MPTPKETVVELERKFWDSLVSNDTRTATGLLCEPALMVSPMGAMKFDHATYTKMANEGSMQLTDYELRDIDVVFPTETTAILTYKVRQRMAVRGKDQELVQDMNDSSTWVRSDGKWLCAAHTETPIESRQKH